MSKEIPLAQKELNRIHAEALEEDKKRNASSAQPKADANLPEQINKRIELDQAKLEEARRKLKEIGQKKELEIEIARFEDFANTGRSIINALEQAQVIRPESIGQLASGLRELRELIDRGKPDMRDVENALTRIANGVEEVAASSEVAFNSEDLEAVNYAADRLMQMKENCGELFQYLQGVQEKDAENLTRLFSSLADSAESKSYRLRSMAEVMSDLINRRI